MHNLAFSVLLLLGSWTLSHVGTNETYPATVPSTVAGVLADNGVAVTDKGIFDGSWTYTCEFDLENAADGRFRRLRSGGLGFRADITLNGTLIASADTTFGVFSVREWDVTPLLKRHNVLQVKLQRAQKGDLNIGFVDWNPRPADESMGIVREMELLESGPLAITDVFIKPCVNLSGDTSADLEVQVTLHNFSGKTAEDMLSGSWAGGSFGMPVSLDAGQTRTFVLTSAACPALHQEKPSLWWPRGLGEPVMQSMQVSVGAGAASDSRTVDFGIRKIESEIDAEGHLQFIVNGRKVLLKGGGWTDEVNLRDTHGSLEAQMAHVVNMGLNCIRFENIWGKDSYIYDLCDRNGIMALVGFSCQWEWEDYCGLPQSSRYGCITDKASMDLAARYFADQVRWLRGHPSLIGWLTGSDRIPAPELEKRYLQIYAALDYRPYVCSAKSIVSTLSGPSGTKMEGPYEYVAPDYWYTDTQNGGAFGFNTETGIGANWPQIESLRRMIPGEEARWPLGEAFDRLCTASSSAMNTTAFLRNAVDSQYGESSSLEEFTRKAHALGYDGTRAMFEAFRCNLPHTTGIIQWMLNSACPSLYWQLYDSYLAPTGDYYGVKKACEPVQLIFNHKDYKVYAVNETGAECTLHAGVQLFDPASSLLGAAEADVTVRDREPLEVFCLDSLRGRDFFAALSIRDGADNFYCIPAAPAEYDWENTSWYVTPAKSYASMEFVSNLPQTAIGYRIAEAAGPEEGTRTLTVTLSNPTELIAYQNIAKLVGPDGNLVEPAIWSDNFVTLLPGQTKVLTCKAPADAAGTVRIDSWNAAASPLDDGSRDRSKYADNSFSDDERYHVENPYPTVTVGPSRGKKIKNVIVMIGDGMGLEQISTGWVLNGGALNMDNFTCTGISRTYAVDRLVTDSCAGGSAIATGVKTNYGYMGLDAAGNTVQNCISKAMSLGKKTGIVVTCRINDATPLDFCGQSTDRHDEEVNAAQFVHSGIDFLAGGGYRFFAGRGDGRNLIGEMEALGYEYCPDADAIAASSSGKILSLPGDTELPPALERGDFLERATMKAIETLDNRKGFVLMVEGSCIDDWAHRNKVGYMAEELFDFDRTIGRVLQWAEKDGQTLVVVTADHCTGGLTILEGSLEGRSVYVNFSTRGHNGIAVPVFAYGPHAEEFNGVHENDEVGRLIMKYVR
mgnify:FL=1